MKKNESLMLIRSALNSIFEKRRCLLNRARLKNKDFSIISSNCNGGVILHDLGLKFDTPTIDLFFKPSDYLKLVQNLKKYLTAELTEFNIESPYPVGSILDIKVYFLHYKSFSVAKEKWDERCKRVHYDNLYFMMTDRDGCTYEQIEEYDKLQVKHKVIFTHVPYKFKSSYYIKGFEKSNCVGVLSNFRYFLIGKKYFDDFNYVRWLNNRG